LLAFYDSSGETLVPVLEKNDHGRTVYGLRLDNAASDANRLFKLNPVASLGDQLAAARREDHLLLDDSAELRTLAGTDDRIAVILPGDYRPGQRLANQARAAPVRAEGLYCHPRRSAAGQCPGIL
ncbi:hypothetical protein, partial [Endozoicomonas sp. ALC066]|uniref:hypothetical protein n=1 Tax=Endozoicomonas sp. ALC066 TaxID=3403078 RepID=UPI003BB80424